MNRTRIEYGDLMWSVTEGCDHGCPYCWSRVRAVRFNKGDFSPKLHPERLGEPLRRKKPARILVSLQSELFGEWVPSSFIQQVVDVMRQCPQHTFLLLTKNPSRYQEFNLPTNAWAGTSIENQAAAEKRIPELLKAKAKVRWLSVEPILGPVDLSAYLPCQRCSGTGLEPEGTPCWHPEYGCRECDGPPYDAVNWVVVGGQTGPGAIIPRLEWLASIVGHCEDAGVPLFVKGKLASVVAESPIRQYPKEELPHE